MSVEVFCVQTIWRASASRYEPGQFQQFGTRQCAVEAGKRLARTRPGVIVFRVSGDPTSDIWQSPEVIARFGDVPPMPIAA